MKIALISNINVDMLIQMTSKKYEVFHTEGYGLWKTYALSKDKKLSEFDPKVIFLIIDGYALLESCDSLNAGMQEIDNTYSIIRSMALNYPQSIIAINQLNIRTKKIASGTSVSNESEWEYAWNNKLQELSRELLNVLPFEMGSLSYSNKMWYMGSIPYSIKDYQIILKSIDEFVRKLVMTRKKVLICDLDNTLWGGVIGEDGPSGIILGESLLGAAYRDTQKRIKEISDTGILLAIVSKNNPDDADLAFEKNEFMYLKKEDFIAIKCNWKAKSENIIDLSKELNLGLDAFVFLDDNPVEREEVSSRLPEVTIADFPTDVSMLPNTIEDIYKKYFWCWRETKEDKEKTEQYKHEAQRHKDLENASSMEDYLKSLNINIELGNPRENQIERIVQLINKTNQFNTNTRRFDMQEFIQYNGRTFVAKVSDKYGDSGLVAVVMISTDGTTATIDNFLMSCRVMGRQIENAIMLAIEDKLTHEGINKIFSSYIQSPKNKPVEDLYEKLCFTVIKTDSNDKYYEKALPSNDTTLLKVKWVN